MSLCNFSIIVAIDSNGGIAREGNIPWTLRSDMKFFRDTTTGKNKNAIIMGRKTYQSIPSQHRPLPNRFNIVVSRTWKQEDFPGVSICPSFVEALAMLGNTPRRYNEIFLVGGEMLYNEAIKDYLYLCNKIYVTRLKMDYECDQFFPWSSISHLVVEGKMFLDIQKTRDYNRYFLEPDDSHEEYHYLNALRYIADNGESRPDRTGIGTKSIFGATMTFDISERLPVITTKRVSFDNILRELLFFVSGKTNTKVLEEQGVNIWKGNTSRSFLDSKELEYEEGDMGPGYGFQWRHWGADYDGCDESYHEKGIDQLKHLIEQIKENPHSRRHILSAWNVTQLEEMALPPCHLLAQFYVSGDRKYLDCQLYQRSADMFLGVPYNITSYSLLTCMIAHLTGLKPRKFSHVLGDAHIYNNHIEQAYKQLGRVPRPFPTLRFRRGAKIHEIDQFDFDSFVLEGYTSWPIISAPMAI